MNAMKKCFVLLACILICAGNAFAEEVSESSDIPVMSYSQDIASAVRNFLIDDDWKFDFNDGRGIFMFGVNIGGKMKNVDCRLIIRDDSYTSYAISPINADADDADVMKNIAEFVCRANYGIRNGNFELDMRDGELRYKVHVDCSGGVPARSVIRNSIYVPAVAFEHYAPGMLDVIFKGASAAEAIKQCEN